MTQADKRARKTHARRALFLFCMLIGILLAGGLIGYYFYRTVGPGNSSVASSTPSSTISVISVATSTSPTSSPAVATAHPPAPTSTPAVVPVSKPPIVVSATNTAAYGFGIAAGGDLTSLSDSALNTELDGIAKLGVGWIRFDMQWSDVQRTGSETFNWNNIDRVVAAANARHLRILAILDYTPAWARSYECPDTIHCAPADPTLFAAFAKAAAERYTSQGVIDWEIWNEPNLMGYWPSTVNHVSNYVTLLEAAYTAIKAVNPSAGVISGSLAPAATTNSGSIAPLDFLTQMYTDGAKNYFDAVGFHPYSYPAMPNDFQNWNAWSQMASTSPSLRSIMAANGDAGKHIWITEYGAPTDGPGNLETEGDGNSFPGQPDHVTEALQDEMLIEAVAQVRTFPWAGPFFWYSYQDLGTSQDTNENFFGLVRYDGSTKPAYDALEYLIASQ